jgi:transcriptional regulator with XRE-family HTH domain
MRTELLTASPEDEKPLAGEELRELRVLAGFSQPALERCAGLSTGRVTSIENGRAHFRPWEWAEVKRLLFEEMGNRARAIAKHLPAGGPALAEERESSSP